MNTKNYSHDDLANIERIREWVKTHPDYSFAALARLARISPSALNQIIHGKYATSPEPLLGKVLQAMKNHDDAGGNGRGAVVVTSVYTIAQAACKMARRYKNFAVVSGWVGTGKTFSLKAYAAKHPNTHLVEATPTMTPSSLIKLLARLVAGMNGVSNRDDCFQAVINALKDTDSLLIIDEAETLSPKQLHTLRRIRDLTNIGIVLSGTEHLSGVLKPERGQFDQIRSRTGFWPATMTGITEDDAIALIQSHFTEDTIPDEVTARLYKYSRGSARMLVEGLIAGIREFRKGRPLSVEMVDTVAQRVLCLQSVS